MVTCSSHASATATCEQRRPKQGAGKNQASDAYKWLSLAPLAQHPRIPLLKSCRFKMHFP